MVAQWLILGGGVLAAGLILYNTVVQQRQRTAAFGPNPWTWIVILSRVFLLLPFLALAVGRGRWPGVTAVGVWLALSALFMLGADIGDRIALVRAYRARRAPPPRTPPRP